MTDVIHANFRARPRPVTVWEAGPAEPCKVVLTRAEQEHADLMASINATVRDIGSAGFVAHSPRLSHDTKMERAAHARRLAKRLTLLMADLVATLPRPQPQDAA